MIQFNGPATPPAMTDQAYAFVGHLLAILSDPKTARRQLDELMKASKREAGCCPRRARAAQHGARSGI
jgi:hypothetical protein